MNLFIDTYNGVGPIKLGMTMKEVRTAIGLPFKTFKKTSTDVMPTDAFDEAGIYVYYKAPGVCEAIEMGGVAEPTLRGATILRRSFSEVLAWIRSLDRDVQVSKSGLKSFQLGISVYASGVGEDPSEPVQGVLVFERGYYD